MVTAVLFTMITQLSLSVAFTENGLEPVTVTYWLTPALALTVSPDSRTTYVILFFKLVASVAFSGKVASNVDLEILPLAVLPSVAKT